MANIFKLFYFQKAIKANKIKIKIICKYDKIGKPFGKDFI